MAPCVGSVVLAQNAPTTDLQLSSVDAELRPNHSRRSRGRWRAVRKGISQELEELSSNHESLAEQERTRVLLPRRAPGCPGQRQVRPKDLAV